MVAFDNWSSRTAAAQAGQRWRRGDRAVYRRVEGLFSWVRIMDADGENGELLVCLEMMRRGRGRRVYPFLVPAERLFASMEDALVDAPMPSWPSPFFGDNAPDQAFLSGPSVEAAVELP